MPLMHPERAKVPMLTAGTRPKGAVDYADGHPPGCPSAVPDEAVAGADPHACTSWLDHIPLR
jgi:hypothetical protein